jgi:hypothetical protein
MLRMRMPQPALLEGRLPRPALKVVLLPIIQGNWFPHVIVQRIGNSGEFDYDRWRPCQRRSDRHDRDVEELM